MIPRLTTVVSIKLFYRLNFKTNITLKLAIYNLHVHAKRAHQRILNHKIS